MPNFVKQVLDSMAVYLALPGSCNWNPFSRHLTFPGCVVDSLVCNIDLYHSTPRWLFLYSFSLQRSIMRAHIPKMKKPTRWLCEYMRCMHSAWKPATMNIQIIHDNLEMQFLQQLLKSIMDTDHSPGHLLVLCFPVHQNGRDHYQVLICSLQWLTGWNQIALKLSIKKSDKIRWRHLSLAGCFLLCVLFLIKWGSPSSVPSQHQEEEPFSTGIRLLPHKLHGRCPPKCC